jgi:hypothetical protein
MRNFVFRAIMVSFRKNNLRSSFLNSILTIFKKMKLMLIKLLGTTLSASGLIFFNSMLTLLQFSFFLLVHTSSYLMAL